MEVAEEQDQQIEKLMRLAVVLHFVGHHSPVAK
jgi:hypothetical protein